MNNKIRVPYKGVGLIKMMMQMMLVCYIILWIGVLECEGQESESPLCIIRDQPAEVIPNMCG